MRRRLIAARRALEIKEAERLKKEKKEGYEVCLDLNKDSFEPSDDIEIAEIEDKQPTPKKRGRPLKKDVVKDSPTLWIETGQTLNDDICRTTGVDS